MRARLAMLLLGALGAPGCTVYEHVTEPLDVDFHATPVYDGTGRHSVKRFKYQYVDVQWDSNAIHEIARRNGIDPVHYADLETLVVLGVWTQKWVHVYGVPSAGAAAAASAP